MERPAQDRQPAQQDDAAGLPDTVRLNSRDLFRHARAVQIEHEGKIYELRLTRLNKLILTA